ncbi:MAG TPA: phosphate ABC transporter permease subunit PstC [Thermoplasmata archaeon]|nr:phosphate ABC transporter permease subunit PstC [Thermoplasmata archaeon]
MARVTGTEGGRPVRQVTRGVLALAPRQFWGAGETVVRTALFLAAALAVVVTIAIFLALVVDTVPFFARVSPVDFYAGTVWSPDIRGIYGVLPLVAGTLIIAGAGCLIGIPLGLAAAVFLREYAPARVREVLKPVLEILAGIPTIVYGLFALLAIAPVLQTWFGASFFNGANAILVIGIMIIPMVSSLSEDALTAVPIDLRDGALALGATHFEATRRVVLPAALSGVVASFILAFSRAVGETMIVLIVAGQNTDLTLNVFGQMTTMAGWIAKRATGDVAVGETVYLAMFAVGVTLFLITLVLNLISDYLRTRFREEYD